MLGFGDFPPSFKEKNNASEIQQMIVTGEFSLAFEIEFDALLRGEPVPTSGTPLTRESIHTVFVHVSRAVRLEGGVVVVGDNKGRVGAAVGKANEVPEAIRKGMERAKKDMIQVPIINGTSRPWGAAGEKGCVGSS